jgi:sugar fermentation stimulation protein A
MRYPEPLARGRLIRRYKRFLADVVLDDGAAITAHCPNPGSMLGVSAPGSTVWLSHSRDPKRKLPYRLELIDAGPSLVGVNPNLANTIAAEAIAAGRIPELAGYARMRREVRYGENSRIDLLLEDDLEGDLENDLEDGGRPPCHVEVKSVTMRRDTGAHGIAEFPDAATKRGTKHLGELAAVVAAGGRAAMLYIAQRCDCQAFAVADDIDPAYAAAFASARAAGVTMIAVGCTVSPEGIAVAAPLAMPP